MVGSVSATFGFSKIVAKVAVKRAQCELVHKLQSE